MTVSPNLSDYATITKSFDWEQEKSGLSGLKDGKGLNIAYEAVDRHAVGKLKDQVALRFIHADLSSTDYTYSQLYELTNKFANVLDALGVGKSERVFSFIIRAPELYYGALGSLKKGAVFCPLFSVFGPEPVFQRLSRGDAKVLITTKEQYDNKINQLLGRLPKLEYVLLTDIPKDESEQVRSLEALMAEASTEFKIPVTDPEDPALLHFTSGTTGMPKGALHVHKAVLVHYVTGKYVLDFHPNDIYWCTADPGWVTGTSYGIVAPLVHGVTNIVDEEEFDATRWYTILEQQQVSVWYTAPTAIRRLMRANIVPKEKYKLDKLRLMLSVGEPLHAEAVKWSEKNFGMPFLDNWWQTETGGIMISNYRSVPVRPGSMGKPLPGVEIAIAELTDDSITITEEADKEGQLVIKRGWPSMFRTYLHDEERYNKSFRGEWYISGDLARRDGDGYFWFVGRADDIIKTSGHMVGPFEVESALMEHPAVAEAAVIGKPDQVAGEIVKAFVVLQEDKQDREKLKMDIIAHARRKLGPAVAPKEISFIDSLPKTRSGKILRRLLKARELGLPEGDLSTLEQP